MDRPSSTESQRNGRSPARSDARSGSNSRPPLTRSSTATKTSSPLTASTTHSNADHGHAQNPLPLPIHAASRRGLPGSMHSGTPATTLAGTPVGTPTSRKSSGWEHISAADQATTAAVEGDMWPRSPSDDSSDETPPGATTLKKVAPARKSGQGPSGLRFLRSITKKLVTKAGRSRTRWGLFAYDEAERARNEIQHRIITDLLDGRLHVAPPTMPRRVLDIGTGPGCWALDYAKLHPESSVVGIDINPVRPAYKLPNCQFVLMDATEEWDFKEKFDFIHARMLGELPNKHRLIQEIYDNLNPGGWAEFTEWVMVIRSPNRSLEGTALLKWNNVLRDALHKLGTSASYPLEFESLLNRGGFEGITMRKFAAPTNACYPGNKAQKIGNLMTQNYDQAIGPLTIPVLTALGWKTEDAELLVADVRRELGDTRYHSFTTLVSFYCRKPAVETPKLSMSSMSTLSSGRRGESFQAGSHG